MTKRNIEIHRTDVPVQGNFKRGISENVPISDSVGIEVRDKDGNLKTRSEPTKVDNQTPSKTIQSQNKPLSPSSDSVEWFFTDFKNDNVITVSNSFLNLVKSFVTDIRKAYP